MDAEFRMKVKQFLTGDLSREETIKVLDQVKSSESCRRYLEEQSQIAASSRKGGLAKHRATSGSTCGAIDPAAKMQKHLRSSRPEEWASLMGTNKGRRMRRLVILAVVMLALTSTAYYNPFAKTEIDVNDLWILESISEGIPVIRSPKGEFKVRPMGIATVLPRANKTIRIVITCDGVVVYDAQKRVSDQGTTFEDEIIKSGGKEALVIEALTPFPGADELTLEKGKKYFMYIELPNEQQSAPTLIAF